MSNADPDSRPIYEDDFPDPLAVYCKRCGDGPLEENHDIEAWNPKHRTAWWTLCGACFELLVATIEVEVEYGPGVPPPEAWTKVRKLRAARRRRWSKADP